MLSSPEAAGAVLVGKAEAGEMIAAAARLATEAAIKSLFLIGCSLFLLARRGVTRHVNDH